MKKAINTEDHGRIPQMLFDEKLQEMKKNHHAASAGTEGFWRQRPRKKRQSV